MEDLAAAVRESLADRTRAEFEERVERQAEAMREDIAAGVLDNPDFATGLELEAYAVDGEGRLVPIPEAVYDLEGCDGELGVHNVEIHTPPDALDAEGLDRQAASVRDRVASVRRRLHDSGHDLVLDGMWTIPPPEGTESYLGSVTERDGVVVAEHMRASPRYVAIDNEVLRQADGSVPLSVPGFDGAVPTILVESLTSSIQPHLQVPDASTFPTTFNTALRTAGPVLALTTNSPFLPADRYAANDETDLAGRDPLGLVDETHHELRISTFEQSINAGLDAADAKVRFPRDIEATTDVVDRLVADHTYAPFLSDADWADASYDRRYPELAHKRGTYWRWIRAVVGGRRPRGSDGTEASIRIEYRPIPTQPTVRDVVACQALVCGLLRGLTAADHPLATLSWSAARDSFYDAARAGLDADLAWVTAGGDRTSDRDQIFAEVFEYARRGLEASGLASDRIDELLGPLAARWERRITPSRWKKTRVRERVEAGDPLPDAITGMQRTYVELAANHDVFVAMAD